MSLKVVSAHKHPEYLRDCCKIINEEWKRSETARMHSLMQSTDNLPTSLLLLKDKVVIGHIKLTEIPTNKSACFVQSLVIARNQRGKGYGSYLMKKAEDFCRSLNLKTIVLSTQGQEQFYSKLGYEECSPVSIYGCGLAIVKKSFTHKTDENSIIKSESNTSANNNGITSGSSFVPPPAPPSPPKVSSESIKNHKTFMRKDL